MKVNPSPRRPLGHHFRIGRFVASPKVRRLDVIEKGRGEVNQILEVRDGVGVVEVNAVQAARWASTNWSTVRAAPPVKSFSTASRAWRSGPATS